MDDGDTTTRQAVGGRLTGWLRGGREDLKTCSVFIGFPQLKYIILNASDLRFVPARPLKSSARRWAIHVHGSTFFDDANKPTNDYSLCFYNHDQGASMSVTRPVDSCGRWSYLCTVSHWFRSCNRLPSVRARGSARADGDRASLNLRKA